VRWIGQEGEQDRGPERETCGASSTVEREVSLTVDSRFLNRRLKGRYVARRLINICAAILDVRAWHTHCSPSRAQAALVARRAEDVTSEPHETSEPPDSDDERSFEPILAASVVLGFVFGGATMIAMFAMFHMTAQGWMLPLAQQQSWNPPILLVASAVVMVVAYVTLRRRGALEVADRIFLGYLAAIVMAAGVEIAREMFFIVRDHVPQNLGVAMRRTHQAPAGGRSEFGEAGGQERGRGRAPLA
jgi:hypothetical protein